VHKQSDYSKLPDSSISVSKHLCDRHGHRHGTAVKALIWHLCSPP